MTVKLTRRENSQSSWSGCDSWLRILIPLLFLLLVRLCGLFQVLLSCPFLPLALCVVILYLPYH